MNAVTPSEFSHSAICFPSWSTARWPYHRRPGQMTTAQPLALSAGGCQIVSVGLSAVVGSDGPGGPLRPEQCSTLGRPLAMWRVSQTRTRTRSQNSGNRQRDGAMNPKLIVISPKRIRFGMAKQCTAVQTDPTEAVYRDSMATPEPRIRSNRQFASCRRSR